MDAGPMCWGANEKAQAGTWGTSVRIMPTVTDPIDHRYAVSIGTTTQHSCVVERNGKVFCWGPNQYGQLGNGSTAPNATPILSRQNVVGFN